MAQPARVRAQGHLRLTGPAGGQGQSLYARCWIFQHWAKGRPAPGDLAWDEEAELIFNMETAEASEMHNAPQTDRRGLSWQRKSNSASRPGQEGWWDWFAKTKALASTVPTMGDPA